MKLLRLWSCEVVASCGLVVWLAFGAGLTAGYGQGAAAGNQTGNQAGNRMGNRVISGVVLSAKTNHPLAEAQVTLSNSRPRRLMAETMTDAEGRFSFSGLPDGKFELHASHRGYVGSDFDAHAGGVFTAIVTGDGLISTDLQFRLEPLAVIYGTVVEDSGDPVPDAQISLYRKDDRGGMGKIVRAGGAHAGPLGKFEIANLSPGKYYLCASGWPWYANHNAKKVGGDSRISLDVAYAITCYPGVGDSAASEAIVVAGGDRVQADVTMHAVQALHVPVLPQAGNGGIQMPQIRQEVFGFPESVPINMSSTQSTNGDGSTSSRGELTGFPPGRYEVEVQGMNGEPNRLTTLDAASESASFDATSAAPMATVSGKVSLAAGEDVPGQLFIALAPREGDRAASVQVEKDGTFSMHEVRPGEYDVAMSASGMAMATTRLSAKGGVLHGHVLQVSSDPVELTLTAVRAVATVSGFAVRGGHGTPGVFVALLPVSENAGLEARQPNQSDSDGSFYFPNVPAGEYLVMAIDDGWGLDWARREGMAKYMAKAVRVTVPPHAKEVNLPSAVEVQAK